MLAYHVGMDVSQFGLYEKLNWNIECIAIPFRRKRRKSQLRHARFASGIHDVSDQGRSTRENASVPQYNAILSWPVNFTNDTLRTSKMSCPVTFPSWILIAHATNSFVLRLLHRSRTATSGADPAKNCGRGSFFCPGARGRIVGRRHENWAPAHRFGANGSHHALNFRE
jgi:hypothetical protein